LKNREPARNFKPIPSQTLTQVPLLTEEQISTFKRDGLLVLEGVLDPNLCRHLQDQMWEVIAERRPLMKRNQPSTWTPFSKSEVDSFLPSEEGGDPYFFGKGHRLHIRNGAEDLMLNTAPRALWNVAEQLLGEGEVVWPAGVNDTGYTSGPCLMTERNIEGMVPHLGSYPKAKLGKPTNRTQNVKLPKTGPIWSTAQGTRGLYCTLPNSPPPIDNYNKAHAEAMYDTRWRLQFAAYIDDLPPQSGGLTLWPGSHRRIWDYWENLHLDQASSTPKKSSPQWDGYSCPPLLDIKADTEPIETSGPIGSVVLWHANLLHTAGQNTRSDVIRQATIHAFAKTSHSVPDELVLRDPVGDLWRDWSEDIRLI
tara:strand:+ start:47604 stop:48701 length:1098 start_codon:yes stop_codon:yes gene_type:complete